MAELIATAAAAGLAPRTIGTCTLSEETPQITSVAPFKGQQSALAKALPNGFPKPGQSAGDLIWSARNQAFALGPLPDLAGLAATTDQTDAWATLVLSGADSAEVLARVTPLDPATLGPGQTARSLLGHMTALYWRRGDDIVIFVFRSMAATAVHEITHAMTSVAARAQAL